jgi:hypothetical protein
MICSRIDITDYHLLFSAGTAIMIKSACARSVQAIIGVLANKCCYVYGCTGNPVFTAKIGILIEKAYRPVEIC